ncbi:MAG: Endoglucanase E precursor [Firmicutes bacterium ADurb.Bin193]|nr:MAG: Endoglucanase E precursor [Firmicutes bacterium ADurb.Bin193]
MMKKKSSKFLALALCLTMLVLAVPVIGFAGGDPITITDGTVTDNADNTLKTVTVTYSTTDEVGDEVTILATFEGFDVQIGEGGVLENVAYISQEEKSDTITFVIDKAAFVAAGEKLYVKMGGIGVSTPAEYVIGSGTEPEVTLGDVNGDGAVNATDAGLVLQYFVGTITEFSSPNGLAAADINNDGVINATDAGLILQYFVGTITEF